MLEHFDIAVDGGDAHTETLACLENGARRLFLEHAQQQLTPLAGAYPSAGGSIPILLRRQTTLAPIAPRGHAAFVRKIPRGVSELLFLVLTGENGHKKIEALLIGLEDGIGRAVVPQRGEHLPYASVAALSETQLLQVLAHPSVSVPSAHRPKLP